MNCPQCKNTLDTSSQFCKYCGYKINSSLISPGQTSAVPEYFSISPTRLVSLSVISFGLYEAYWFYRNWHAVKKFEQSNISPLFLALFSVFYCVGLFNTIMDKAKETGYTSAQKGSTLGTYYILLLIVSNGLNRIETNDLGYNVIILVISALTVLPLISVQKAINHIHSTQGLPQYTGVRVGEVIVVIVGALLFALVWLGILILAIGPTT